MSDEPINEKYTLNEFLIFDFDPRTRQLKPRLLTTIILAFILFFSQILISPQEAMAAQPSVVLSGVKGEVLVKKGGGLLELPATNGMELVQGDWLRTGKKGTAKLSYGDGTEATIGSNSSLTIQRLSKSDSLGTSALSEARVTFSENGQQSSLQLQSGSIWSKVKSLLNMDDSYEVETPTAVMGVRGTLYLVSVNPENGATQGDVIEGVVGVSQNNEATQSAPIQLVTMGRTLRLVSLDEPMPGHQVIDPQELIRSTQAELLVQLVNDIAERAKDLTVLTQEQQQAYKQTGVVDHLKAAIGTSFRVDELARFGKEFVSSLKTSDKLEEVKQVLRDNNQSIEQLQSTIDTMKKETEEIRSEVIEAAEEAGVSEEEIESIGKEAAGIPLTPTASTPGPNPPSSPASGRGNSGGNNTSDTIAPVIQLKGSAIQEVANGADYTDAGVTVTDNRDLGLNAIVTYTKDEILVSSIDTSVPGTYVVHYNVQDAAGNKAIEVTRTVVVACNLEVPTGLQVITGNNFAVLVWGSVEGATSYKIYQSTESDGQYTEVSPDIPKIKNNYMLLGLSNGTTYYFKVKAYNESGGSLFSEEISAVPELVVPGTVHGLQAIVGDSQVRLNWDNEAGATFYRIYQATDESGPYTEVDSVITKTEANYTVSGLTNGVTYYYFVRAGNGAGEGVESNVVSVEPGISLGTVDISSTFTDDNFRQAVWEWLGNSGEPGAFTQQDLCDQMELNWNILDISEREITSLAGLESFEGTGLRILNCSHNTLSNLPSLPTTLTDLFCEHNYLNVYSDPLKTVIDNCTASYMQYTPQYRHCYSGSPIILVIGTSHALIDNELCLQESYNGDDWSYVTDTQISKYTYSSSDEEVATVTSGGVINAKDQGSCVIYAKYGDIDSDFTTILIEVTVVETVEPAAATPSVMQINNGSSANMYEPGDEITLKFNKPIAVSNITIGKLNSALSAVQLDATFGTDGSVSPYFEISGYASEFVITMGTDVSVPAGGLTFSLGKDDIIDELGIKAAVDVNFTIPNILDNYTTITNPLDDSHLKQLAYSFITGTMDNCSDQSPYQPMPYPINKLYVTIRYDKWDNYPKYLQDDGSWGSSIHKINAVSNLGNFVTWRADFNAAQLNAINSQDGRYLISLFVDTGYMTKKKDYDSCFYIDKTGPKLSMIDSYQTLDTLDLYLDESLPYATGTELKSHFSLTKADGSATTATIESAKLYDYRITLTISSEDLDGLDKLIVLPTLTDEWGNPAIEEAVAVVKKDLNGWRKNAPPEMWFDFSNDMTHLVVEMTEDLGFQTGNDLKEYFSLKNRGDTSTTGRITAAIYDKSNSTITFTVDRGDLGAYGELEVLSALKDADGYHFVEQRIATVNSVADAWEFDNEGPYMVGYNQNLISELEIVVSEELDFNHNSDLKDYFILNKEDGSLTTGSITSAIYHRDADSGDYVISFIIDPGDIDANGTLRFLPSPSFTDILGNKAYYSIVGWVSPDLQRWIPGY